VSLYPPFDPAIRRIPGSLSLVLPAHDEQDNIGPVIERALEVLPHVADTFEIVVVDDGSRDATAAIVEGIAARDPRVRLVRHPRNMGYGATLKDGFAATVGDYVMFMDSDRQFDIADLRLLSPFVGEFDVVAGFRLERSDPLYRRVFAETFNLVVRLLFGVHLRDIDCAFKVFRGDQLRALPLTTSGALINTEMQARLRRQGAQLMQVGVRHYPRVAGQSSGGDPRVIFRAMRETPQLWWRLHLPSLPASPRARKAGDVAIAGGALAGIALLATLADLLASRRRGRRPRR